MSDTELAPGSEPDNPAVLKRTPEGEPASLGTRMIEKESYERIVDGLRIAAEAAVHLGRQEPWSIDVWNAIALKLDQCRRAAVQQAGLTDIQRQEQTATDVRGEGLTWRNARGRFRNGLKQAAGGMRQLATCFRGDLVWSRMARTIEDMQRKVLQPALRPSGLILPAVH